MSQENVALIQRGIDHVVRTGEFSPEMFQPDFV